MAKWSFKRLVIGFGSLGVAALAGTACRNGSSGSEEPCKTGEEACRCYGNDSCDDGLTCIANLCLDLNAGSGGKPSETGSGGEAAESVGGDAPSTGGDASGSSAGGTLANGGTLTTGGTVTLGGSAGSGGTAPSEPFPPNPAGCALVTSCVGCCETVGVFALDALANDATPAYVQSFDVSATSASAAFDFATSDEVGAIFFRFLSPQDIGTLQIVGQGVGGSLEVALVRANGKDGCIYPIVGGALSPVPDTCWGLGAGPYAVLPADQIEIRVRSLSFGSAALSVSELAFAP